MLKLRGDAPDRFWSSVEPYTSDITESDICMLQEGISSVSLGLCNYSGSCYRGCGAESSQHWVEVHCREHNYNSWWEGGGGGGHY